MKKKDLMSKKEADLEKHLALMKKELFSLRSASLAGEDSLKKKARVKAVRKDIARIYTRLNNNS